MTEKRADYKPTLVNGNIQKLTHRKLQNHKNNIMQQHIDTYSM